VSLAIRFLLFWRGDIARGRISYSFPDLIYDSR
jgi:hypothetical protein